LAKQRVPKYRIADALARLTLTTTERNYVGTALNQFICHGRHTAKGPETEEKHRISKTGYTKKQRHADTPQSNDHSLGDAPKYTHTDSETLGKERVSLPL
jgi:hypothetical protein